MSDSGSDDNDCHSVSAPCRILETVLDRATDGADIYVTSETLSLGVKPGFDGYMNFCKVESSISYTISSYKETYFTPTCHCKSDYIIYYISFNFNKL